MRCLIGEGPADKVAHGANAPKALHPDEWSECQKRAGKMRDEVAWRFKSYSEALPYARAAEDVNELEDRHGSESKGKECLTRLPDSAAELNKILGLHSPGLTDIDLKNDTTGFRAALYRSEADGKLILVPRDTERNSLVDWETNTDNPRKETAQYLSMKSLARKLVRSGAKFDLAGYSKGAGLAQQGGLANTHAKVFVFNPAGIPAKSHTKSLARRTFAYSSEGDFLTFMNNTKDPVSQIANAEFLKAELSRDKASLFHPIAVEYTNPAARAAREARDEAAASFMLGLPPSHDLESAFAKDPDPDFAVQKRRYLHELDLVIEEAGKHKGDPATEPLFPPVCSNHQETIEGSMTRFGKVVLRAEEPKANLGRLYQHRIENVVQPMEKAVREDREAMKQFLDQCG